MQPRQGVGPRRVVEEVGHCVSSRWGFTRLSPRNAPPKILDVLVAKAKADASMMARFAGRSMIGVTAARLSYETYVSLRDMRNYPSSAFDPTQPWRGARASPGAAAAAAGRRRRRQRRRRARLARGAARHGHAAASARGAGRRRRRAHEHPLSRRLPLAVVAARAASHACEIATVRRWQLCTVIPNINMLTRRQYPHARPAQLRTSSRPAAPSYPCAPRARPRQSSA